MSTELNEQFSPHVISKNPSADKFRIQKDKEKPEERFPIGKFPYKTLINLGSRTENCYEKVALVRKDGGVILNHPDVIKNASNKVRCKQFLVDAGLPTPKYQMFAELKLSAAGVQNFRLAFPCVAKLIYGSGGKGMTVINDIKELATFISSKKSEELNTYFIEEVFQPDMSKSYEYRVSVSPLLLMKRVDYPPQSNGVSEINYKGEIIVLRKLMKQEAVDAGSFGRNIALGNSYFTANFERTFSRKGKSCSVDKAVSLALDACMACNLDFGAVDMLWDSESGSWTILEINTAPSMGDENAVLSFSRWKKAFRQMILEKRKEI
jgi:glutathione synthase/RimK-type ligase-like ATP-grasp enzyme